MRWQEGSVSIAKTMEVSVALKCACGSNYTKPKSEHIILFCVDAFPIGACGHQGNSLQPGQAGWPEDHRTGGGEPATLPGRARLSGVGELPGLPGRPCGGWPVQLYQLLPPLPAAEHGQRGPKPPPSPGSQAGTTGPGGGVPAEHEAGLVGRVCVPCGGGRGGHLQPGGPGPTRGQPSGSHQLHQGHGGDCGSLRQEGGGVELRALGGRPGYQVLQHV